MVPWSIVKLEKMPLTANGKLDRRALPKPEARGEREYEGPRNAVEEIVSGIWSEVLKVEKVGIHDNFFELGGHSLLATQVVSRVRSALGVEVRLRALFTEQTVAGFAAEVEQERSKGGEGVAAAIERAGREGEMPLSYAQQRMWFIDQLEPGSAAYNIPCAVRLSGRLDEEALRRSLNEIVMRHEALRTSFPSRDGAPTQEIHESGELGLEVIDLTKAEEGEREERLEELLAEEARRGFDLSRGPLIRARLMKEGEEEHVLMVNMHHIVSDGWSMEVMVGELAQLYEAFRDGKESPLGEMEIQYADYAVWQRRWLKGEVLERQVEYWKEKLEGVGAMELPTDRARTAVTSHGGGSERFRLREEVTRGLKQMSSREGVTLFMSLLSGFQALLARYSGQMDIAVGTPIAGRNRGEIEGLIGFFVNTLVMRVDVGGEPTVRELLGRVRETALGAYAHQDLPFEKLVEELQPERSLSRTPLFQVMFAMQNVPLEGVAVSGLTLKAEPLEPESTKFEMILRMVEQGGEILGALDYATDLFDGWRIRQLLEHWQRVLEGMVLNQQSRIMDLPLISEQEQRQIVIEWNQTAADYPLDVHVHELFAQQAERCSDAAAAIWEGEHLSYRELNRRSNQLAHYLQRLGVGSEVKVGLYVERSLDMIIGLLGVMKAGGAYLPLDPAYPRERLAYMIEDSECRLILSTQRLEQKLRATDTTVRMLDADWRAIADESDACPETRLAGDNLAYVIYTSGSTGRPKGVMLRHRSLSNYQLWAVRNYSFDIDFLAPVLY